jgi:hypothetical protein
MEIRDDIRSIRLQWAAGAQAGTDGGLFEQENPPTHVSGPTRDVRHLPKWYKTESYEGVEVWKLIASNGTVLLTKVLNYNYQTWQIDIE